MSEKFERLLLYQQITKTVLCYTYMKTAKLHLCPHTCVHTHTHMHTRTHTRTHTCIFHTHANSEIHMCKNTEYVTQYFKKSMSMTVYIHMQFIFHNKFPWFSKTATGVQLHLQHSTIHKQKHSHVKVSKSITQ